jgi:ketosteroid isomerase-like protein
MRAVRLLSLPVLAAGGMLLLGFARSASRAADDKAIVAALDTKYQAAVKANDADGMGAILAEDFILVTGTGKVITRADLLNGARSQSITWEHQEDTDQTVRIWGNTAVVTALLWEKGVATGQTIDKHLWFSDTYVRTPAGWRYVFGQASIALPQ